MKAELVRHEATGFHVDPHSGVVFGLSGRKVGYRSSSEYVRVSTTKGPHPYAHRIVYEAVHGTIPAGMQVNHINGVKFDNRACNLELVTPKGNSRHAVENGLTARGEQHGMAKLTNEQVRQIRETAGVVGPAQWARKLGVSIGTVVRARNPNSWRTA